jgi:hypothetical protein
MDVKVYIGRQTRHDAELRLKNCNPFLDDEYLPQKREQVTFLICDFSYLYAKQGISTTSFLSSLSH